MRALLVSALLLLLPGAASAAWQRVDVAGSMRQMFLLLASFVLTCSGWAAAEVDAPFAAVIEEVLGLYDEADVIAYGEPFTVS